MNPVHKAHGHQDIENGPRTALPLPPGRLSDGPVAAVCQETACNIR